MSDNHRHGLEESKKRVMDYVAQIHVTSMNHCHLDVSQFSVSFTEDPPRIIGDRTESNVHVSINFGNMNRELMDCIKFAIENTPEPVGGLRQVILQSWQRRYDTLIH